MNMTREQILESPLFALFKEAVRSGLKERMKVSDAFIDTLYMVDEHVLIAGFTATDLPDWEKAEATAKNIGGIIPMNTARHGDKAMSGEQRKMIFALYRELGIGEELRHDVQYGVAKKTSLTDFTANDAGRLIEHLERLLKQTGGRSADATKPLTSPPKKAGIPGVTSGSVPAPNPLEGDSRPGSYGPGSAGCAGPSSNRASLQHRHDYITKVHKLPSPDQIAVLDHLYKFAGYATLEAQRSFASRIEKHPRPRSMWECEELIFALIAQCAPKMLATISAPGFAERLTPFEYAFMYTNTVKHYMDGTLNRDTYNNAHYELTKYVEKRNQRGRRTMPRFSMTKFFEILEKYSG